MRISDWSSDVCSSDLVEIRPDHAPGAIERIAQHCALLDMSEAEFRLILSMIGRLNRSLIGTRAEPTDFAALRRVMAEQDWTDATGHIRRLHMEWRMIRTEKRRVGKECGSTVKTWGGP